MATIGGTANGDMAMAIPIGLPPIAEKDARDLCIDLPHQPAGQRHAPPSWPPGSSESHPTVQPGGYYFKTFLIPATMFSYFKNHDAYFE